MKYKLILVTQVIQGGWVGHVTKIYGYICNETWGDWIEHMQLDFH